MDRERVVGLQEVAELLGYPKRTVYTWNARKLLPPADMQVSGQVAWYVSTIEQWAQETGRRR